MYIIYDFKCRDCGNVFESMEQNTVHEIACKACGGPSDRQISPVRSKLDPVSGDFPGATYKWERDHERAGRTGKL